MRRFVAILGLSLFALCVSTAAAAPQRSSPPAPAAPAVVGTWNGKVSTDSGEMKISVTVKSVDGKFTGSIDSPHGAWPITEGSVKEDVWTLKFSAGNGDGTFMKGQINGDEFTGEWNNAPMAVGTFALTRVKK